MTRLAAIDCGTNTIRLLVADVHTSVGATGKIHHTLTDLTRQMRIVRLGQGVDRTGVLDPVAIERTLAATREYHEMIEHLGAHRLRFVATSATRDASNAEQFSSGVREILGIDPEVVPGSEEARLSFIGAASGVGSHVERPLLVVDIGGGSTELVVGDDRVEESISIDMGSVRVTEKFLTNSPASPVAVPATDPHDEARAVAWIDEQLDRAADAVDLSRVGAIVGVAGTVTTLTAQALGLTSYQPELVDGAELPVDSVNEAIRFMVDQPIAVKASLGFMANGREDVIAAGALIWGRIIERVVAQAATRGHRIDRVWTSEHDILDGMILSMM